MKECIDCLEEKIIQDFHRHSSGRYYSYCKECYKIRRRKYDSKYREENREKILEINKNYRDANRDSEKYKNRVRQNSKNQRLREGDLRKEYYREYKSKNRERFTLYEANRRARINSRGHVSYEEWTHILGIVGKQCLVCGDEKITMDHIMPIAKGGKNCRHNIQPLCQKCNSEKYLSEVNYVGDLYDPECEC